MANRIQIRRDTQNNWDNMNPTLADGELALEYDTNRIKIGDGSNSWSSLAYANSGLPQLASIATTGSFYDLQSNPFPSSYGPSDNGKFLTLNTNTGHYDYLAGFRTTNSANVIYPSGKIGVDQIGDVSFSRGALYYCYQEPNAYTVAYGGSTGWTPPGWLRINSIGPNNTAPVVGNKITDGTDVSTIISIESNWQVQYADVSFMLINISPARSSWKNGSGNLIVFTGDEPHLNAWAQIGNEVVSVPTHSDSNGILGQLAFDSTYIYRCTQTNVSPVSAVYYTPKNSDPGFTNQGASTDIRINNPGGVSTPAIGWVVSDGSSTRTVTNVQATSGQSGNIWILTLDAGIDWTAVTSLTLFSQVAVPGQWKRIAWSSDTW